MCIRDRSGEEKKSKKGITLLAVLAIMSTPVTVPLCIAMLAVLLAAAICVVCVIFSDFIAAFSILPVSYTHLDVYKRQVKRHCRSLR